MIAAAPAKINLRLVVLAREASGYHQIETLFCALDLADTLEFEIDDVGDGASRIRLDVTGADPGPPERNLVTRAALAFYEAAGLTAHARILLRKRIPMGAGLGGGSSDAATTLRVLNALHGDLLPPEALLRIAAALGADVAFFLCGSSLALAWGRGERLLPLPPLPKAPVLLAVPPFASPTAEAYAALARRRAERGEAAGPTDAAHGPALLSLQQFQDWAAVAAAAVNDFEAPLFERHPLLPELKHALRESGAFLSLLSGSGSALFGVYEDSERRDAAARRLAGRFPDCAFLPASTVGANGAANQPRELIPAD